jgi:Protein of unknown function (DUF3277)
MKFVSLRNFSVLVSALPAQPLTDISNYAEGDDVFMAERNSDAVEITMGADGKMTASPTMDESGKVTIKVAPTSGVNRLFNTILNLQRNPQTACPVFMQAADTYRLDAAVGTFGVLVKKGTLSRGKKTGPVTWELQFERLDLTWGDPVFAGLSTAASEAAV